MKHKAGDGIDLSKSCMSRTGKHVKSVIGGKNVVTCKFWEFEELYSSGPKTMKTMIWGYCIQLSQ